MHQAFAGVVVEPVSLAIGVDQCAEVAFAVVFVTQGLAVGQGSGVGLGKYRVVPFAAPAAGVGLGG
ncbi:hypothetical protein [Saccharospirillum impatiens]|uniref:hypothetical protein n=1 Tax=Saccharospirillum impatiens TaxID=169438 RepID=UPI000490FABA|nr:hypothetical protein [Saccharospirillum impatiens]